MSLKRRMKRTAAKGWERGDRAHVDGYEITFKPTQDAWYAELTPAAKAAIVRIHEQIVADQVDESTVRELESLSQTFPRAPVFFNYLVVVLSHMGEPDHADRVSVAMLEQFPDYLFARLNRAEQALGARDEEQVLALLGPRLKLRELLPNRVRYHVSEFAGYYSVVGRFELARGNRLRAAQILTMLEDVAPEENATYALARAFELPHFHDRMNHLLRMMESR